jgi:hypothetical protein
MITLYCRGHRHSATGLCEQCAALKEYALLRVSTCRFGEKKPVCATCEVHCYKQDMRALVRKVMRYAGPRMLLRHPWLAVMHVVDSAR